MNKVLFIQFLGIILITLALCADAMIGNVQEKAMKTYSSTNTEVVR
jgi:adenosine 3'-phospho 5'-phosphosulfate transporter B3